MKKRVFTFDQKMKVLHNAEANGMVAVCRQFDIAQSLHYRWKHMFDQHGIDGIQGQHYKVDPAVRT